MTTEYERGWDIAHQPHAPEPEREVQPHDCEVCGRHFEYADQQCACTSRSNRVPHV